MTAQRIAMVTRLKPEHAELYRRLHADAWPEVLAMLRACGLSGYSIFEHAGLLFACFDYEGDDLAADLGCFRDDPVMRRWLELTDPCQEPLPSAPPGHRWATMAQIFHMP